MMAVSGVAFFLVVLLALAQAREARPWDNPVACPRCHSHEVVYILYGEPQLDEDLQRALASRKVELGGCLVTRDSKRWECRSCGFAWGEAIPGGDSKDR
jgi:hypothetical protein